MATNLPQQGPEGSDQDNNPAYSDPRLTRLLKNLSGVLATLLGILVFLGAVIEVPTILMPLWAVYTLATGIICFGLVQLLYRPYTAQIASVYNWIFVLFALAGCILVAGYAANLAFFGWILLIMQGIIFFGRNRANLIYLLMTISVLLWIKVTPVPLNPSTTVIVLSQTLVVGILSLLTAYVWSMVTDNLKKLRLSREHEAVERQRLVTLINGMADAVIGTDRQGVVLIYNAATLNLLNTNVSLTGQPIAKFLRLMDPNGQPFNLMQALSGAGRRFTRNDLSYVYGDNDKARLYLSVASVQSNYKAGLDDGGYIFVLRDITKEKSLEDERNEFISVVSHELRTPVAIMEGSISNLQYLLRQAGGLPKADLQATVDKTHEQALYLANMINDLSALSQAERNEAEKSEEIDINQLLANLAHKYEPGAKEKGLALTVQTEPDLGTLTTSKLYLEEILQNLLSNAIKYTAKGSVTLAAKRQDGGVEVSVTDTGIGIATSDQKHVFDKFWRSEDFRTRETSGTGLGLYIAQRLAASLGARIEMQSQLDHGSTFRLLLKNTKY